MRTPENRDEVTLVIAGALLRFLAVLAAGVLVLLVAREVRGGDWFVDPSLGPLTVLAGLVAVANLYRNRRP